jgi:hypothetical protein
MPELSPQAQSILDVMWFDYFETVGDKRSLAADIIRAVADQVAPEDFDYWDGRTDDYSFGCETGQNERNAHVRAELLSIAAELETFNTKEH